MNDLTVDPSDEETPSAWEERFENQINAFFDEAIARVPGFVDRHLKSFRSIMKRSVSPKTGLGDVMVSMRNMLSGISGAVGGPDFSRDTYTHEELTRAFEREVVSSDELESLINRLFREFEQDQWERLAAAHSDLGGHSNEVDTEEIRSRIEAMMEQEIAHDPLLGQVIRSGVKVGLPATLGYVLFGKVNLSGLDAADASQALGEMHREKLDLYNRTLLKIGKYQVPGWVGAVGLAGGLVGTLAVGGLVEFAVNSLRDVKGSYIRQLNAARYVLLYGEDPEDPEGRGIIHLVRGLERQFDRLAALSSDELREAVSSVEGEATG
jgi:hypothetical protein